MTPPGGGRPWPATTCRGRLVRMVTIVDYGSGNLRSVQKACERLGAAALDICLVADGTTDGWVDFNRHGVWDYLAASMICREAGAVVADFEGRDEVTTDYDDTHTIVVAATTALLEPLLDLRRRHALS